MRVDFQIKDLLIVVDEMGKESYQISDREPHSAGVVLWEREVFSCLKIFLVYCFRCCFSYVLCSDNGDLFSLVFDNFEFLEILKFFVQIMGIFFLCFLIILVSSIS